MLISRLNSIPRFALPYTPADFAAGLHAIISGGPTVAGFPLPLFGDTPRFWTRSGRQALCLLLRALHLEPGSGVALPLFTDPSLVRAIVAAGHRPVFIDIDPRYLTIDPQRLDDHRDAFSAVVAVHLFGHLADMPAIMAAAPNTPVIEDIAHAPFSFLNHRMAGRFGIAAFYSFASTKYWPAGGGGLAIVNDPTIAGDLAEQIRKLSQSSRLCEIPNLFLQAAKAAVFDRRIYGIFGKPLRRWAEDWALLEPRLDQSAIQHSWAAVACRQATRLPERTQRQRARSLQLLERLDAAEDLVLPRERPGSRYNYHLFPVLLRSSAERAAMMAAMWSRFIDTSMIYSNVIQEARRFGYTGGCPVAESVASRLITLPNYASLTTRDIDAVGDLFLCSLRACRRMSADSAPAGQVSDAGFIR